VVMVAPAAQVPMVRKGDLANQARLGAIVVVITEVLVPLAVMAETPARAARAVRGASLP
jgi:hypothetical protein